MRYQYRPPDEPPRVTIRITILVLGSFAGLVLMLLGHGDVGVLGLGGSGSLALFLTILNP